MQMFRIINIGGERQVSICKVTDPSGVLTCYMQTIHRKILFSGTVKFSNETAQEKYFEGFGNKGAYQNEPTKFADGIIKLHEEATSKGRLLISGGTNHDMIIGHEIEQNKFDHIKRSKN